MLLRIARQSYGPFDRHVFGLLQLNGRPFLVTMEPPPGQRGVFVPGESCLPADHYNVSLNASPRSYAAIETPLLVAMPFHAERRAHGTRIGMRIHPGRRVDDVVAEIVVGRRRVGDTVVETKPGFEQLMEQLTAARDRSEAIELEIVDP